MTQLNNGETISEAFFDESRFTDSDLLINTLEELESNPAITILYVHETSHDFEEQPQGEVRIKKITLTQTKLALPVYFKIGYWQQGEV